MTKKDLQITAVCLLNGFSALMFTILGMALLGVISI